jgi:hypothetical protein
MPYLEYHYHMISHMPLRESVVLAMQENDIQDRWISFQEVWGYLDVKPHTIMGWIDKWNMLSSKVCKLWHFRTAKVDNWVRRGISSYEQVVPKW